MEKDLQELRREVLETRNLVIRSESAVKGLQGELRAVAERQRQSDRQRIFATTTAYFLFAALAVLGAYLFARGELRGRGEELARARDDARVAREALEASKVATQEAREQSAHALELYERMNSGNGEKRSRALTEVAGLATGQLSALELKVLKERAAGLSQSVAADALEDGRAAVSRRDFKAANDLLTRYFALVAGRPDDSAQLALGQTRHALRDFKGAVEPLQTFLKNAPASRVGDQAGLLLGESLAESGDRERAVAVWRSTADRYYTSPYAPQMRQRARKLEQELRGAASTPAPAAETR